MYRVRGHLQLPNFRGQAWASIGKSSRCMGHSALTVSLERLTQTWTTNQKKRAARKIRKNRACGKAGKKESMATVLVEGLGRGLEELRHKKHEYSEAPETCDVLFFSSISAPNTVKPTEMLRFPELWVPIS